jgi:DNA-binding MarR family transcriptional regulator
VDEPDPLPASIGGQLYLAHRYARAASNRALQPHGIELRHLAVLGALAAAGPLSQRALVDRLQVDKSSMVYMIDELERQGLAVREKDERDRRSYAVRLTDAGRERLTDAERTTREAMADLVAPLSAAERQQLHDLLARFIEHAGEAAEHPYPAPRK